MASVIERIQAVVSRFRGLGRWPVTSGRNVAAAAPLELAAMGKGLGRDALQAAFHDARSKLVAETPALAIARQKPEPFPIVLSERELAERGWRQAVRLLSRLSPRHCVVLLSRKAGKNLWDELIRCGGFELLRVPADRDVVLRTLRAAWSIWQNRQHPRSVAAGNCT